jgi:hypothetical protein
MAFEDRVAAVMELAKKLGLPPSAIYSEPSSNKVALTATAVPSLSAPADSSRPSSKFQSKDVTSAFALMMGKSSKKVASKLPAVPSLSAPAKSPSSARKFQCKAVTSGGKVQQAGKRVREGLISASRSRKHHRMSEANEIGAFAMSAQEVQPKRLQFGGDVVLPPQPSYLAQVAEDDACARSALVAANALFQGNAKRVRGNISKLQDRPDFREATLAMTTGDGAKNKVPSKRQQAMESVVCALSSFFSKVMKAKGSRTNEDQNAVDAVLCSIVDTSMFDKRLGREVGRLLKIEWKALHRGALLREKIDISPGWVRMCKAACRSQLGHVSIVITSDWLHSDEASRIDNSQKEPVTVVTGCAQDAIVYDKHPRRVFAGTWPVLLERFKLSEAWNQVQLLWPKVNFKTKRKGSPATPKAPLVANIRMLRKHSCPCTFAPGTPDMTSCKVCSTMRVNLKIHAKQRALLCYNAGEVKPRKMPKGLAGWVAPRPQNPCSDCNGACHPGQPHRAFTQSPDEALKILLCDVVRRPQLEMDALNVADVPDASLPRKVFHSLTFFRHSSLPSFFSWSVIRINFPNEMSCFFQWWGGVVLF